MKTPLNRKQFLKASTAIAGFNLLPAGVWSKKPNSKLNIGGIGYGFQGPTSVKSVARHKDVEIVALCDADLVMLTADRKKNKNPDGKQAKAPYPDASRFQDYRDLFATMGDKVDAVVIATPDHTHCPATLEAMKYGKHVYTQKPLTHDIAETRRLIDAAEKTGLVTQMGIQIHSKLEYRLATSYLQSGVIGKIKKVYAWSNKCWGYDGEAPSGTSPIPEGLDWNLWLGTAPERDFIKGKYHARQWRRYVDFGCGTLGDMGVHIFDTPFNALELEPATWVQTECRPHNGFSHPEHNKVRLGFAPTKYTTSDFEFIWTDGKGAIPIDAPDIELAAGYKLPDQGAYFIGEEGNMLLEHIAGPRFFPQSIHAKLVKPDIPANVDHYLQWVDTIVGTENAACSAPFSYGGKLTETVLLGTIASRFPGKRLDWNSKAMKFTNMPQANPYVNLKYRKF